MRTQRRTVVGGWRGWAMPPPSGIFALYPHNRHLSAKVRAFVDFLVARFGPGGDWDRPPASVAEG